MWGVSWAGGSDGSADPPAPPPMVTPLSHDLRWLWIPERITFRLAVLAYRSQNGLSPQYLADDLHRVTEIESRRRLGSAATAALADHPSHGAFYNRRSRFLCCSRSGLELSYALGDVISVSSGFPEKSQDISFHPIVPVIATVCQQSNIVTLFFSAFYVWYILFFILSCFYVAWSCRLLAICYVNLIRFCITLNNSPTPALTSPGRPHQDGTSRRELYGDWLIGRMKHFT